MLCAGASTAFIRRQSPPIVRHRNRRHPNCCRTTNVLYLRHLVIYNIRARYSARRITTCVPCWIKCVCCRSISRRSSYAPATGRNCADGHPTMCADFQWKWGTVLDVASLECLHLRNNENAGFSLTTRDVLLVGENSDWMLNDFEQSNSWKRFLDDSERLSINKSVDCLSRSCRHLFFDLHCISKAECLSEIPPSWKIFRPINYQTTIKI